MYLHGKITKLITPTYLSIASVLSVNDLEYQR